MKKLLRWSLGILMFVCVGLTVASLVFHWGAEATISAILACVASAVGLLASIHVNSGRSIWGTMPWHQKGGKR